MFGSEIVSSFSAISNGLGGSVQNPNTNKKKKKKKKKKMSKPRNCFDAVTMSSEESSKDSQSFSNIQSSGMLGKISN